MIAQHPLRRQLGATLLVNDVVDHAGLTYAFRLSEEMAVSATDAVRAFAVVTEVYDLRSLWRWIDTEGRFLPTSVTDHMILQTRRLLDRASRWMLSHRPQPLDVGAEIDRFQPVVRELGGVVADLLKGGERDAVEQETRRLVDNHVREPIARRLASLVATYSLLDIAEIAEAAGHLHGVTAELYFALSEHLGVDRMLNAVAALAHGNRWHALARLALRDDLYHSLRAVTLDVLLTSNHTDRTKGKISKWRQANTARLARARRTLDEIGASERHDLPTLSVAANQIRRMVRT
jgi:glutamate dehydrogenase